MRHKRLFTVALVTGIATTFAAAHALEGEAGYVGELLLTTAGVQSGVGYAAPHAVAWQDLATVVFSAGPNNGGQRDGLAASGTGDLYLLIHGFDAQNSGPQYTGLVRYDGTTLTSLVQDRTSSPDVGDWVGAELQAVVVSPTSTGALTADDPVILRQVNFEVAGTLTATFDIVSIDRTTGAETLIHSFPLADADGNARFAIDGSGGATDGVIYVGPLRDGSIARLAYSGGSYVRTSVPIAFDAADGLTIDSSGQLYTFDASRTSWSSLVSPYPDHEILRVDPATGNASPFGWVDGKQFVFDWVWDDADTLWLALRKSGKKPVRYITDVPPGAVTNVRDRVSSSDATPMSIAAGPDGVLYVLERPFETQGSIWRLAPSSNGGGGGDDGGGGGNGNGNGKGKKK